MSSTPSNAAPPGTPRPDGSDGHRLVLAPGRAADRLHLGQIMRRETTGGLLMLVATIAALLAANLAPGAYQGLMHTQIGPMSLSHWVSDGLLTVFFFVAGLELKRELVEGSLSRPADALLPILAALGGMVTPALVYLAITTGMGGDRSGWAIPMATDIAFALAVLALVGSRLPVGLRAFLLTLAIVDDLGAILVIATVFSHGLDLAWLAGSLACIALFWFLQRRGFEKPLVYLLLGIVAWWAMHQSGVHATIAGVAMGLAVRTNEAELHDCADRWQHALEPWSAGLVVPVFAFCAAGVAVDAEMARGLVERPEALGIALGLVVGKFVGVLGAAWLTARLTAARLAPGVAWADVAAVAALTGIGFTVSLLIADLAFPADPALAETARAAVLAGSLVAAVLGAAALRHRNKTHALGAHPAAEACPPGA